MNDITSYRPNWRYDIWADIEEFFPKGKMIYAKPTKVSCNYAFLTTENGVNCFLHKSKVNSRFSVKDLTDVIENGITFECIVIDYNKEKESLIVSLNFN